MIARAGVSFRRAPALYLRRRMHLHLLVEVSGDPPLVRPGSAHEPKREDYAAVQWVARYLTREDHARETPAVLVFTDVDRAARYGGVMLAEGGSVAIISTEHEKVQECAFGGDPNGLCIVNPVITHPPGMLVEVSKLEEWVRTLEEAEQD
jgi:hypothetical protein